MKRGSGSATTKRSGGAPVPDIRVEPRLSVDIASQRYICSFCSKSFQTLQSLGGHQTSHRQEIKGMRQQHEAFMEAQRLKPKPLRTSSGSHGIRLVPLTPNYAYWEAHRRANLSPKVINFVEIQRPEVARQLPQAPADRMVHSSEKTITDPMLTLLRDVVQGEEVNSVNLDVTLKL